MVHTWECFLPLTSQYPWQDTWPLWGIFQLWNRLEPHSLGLQGPDLNSNCINSWNPLIVSGFCWLALVDFHIGQFYCVRMCAYTPNFFIFKALIFSHLRCHDLAGNPFFIVPASYNKRYFCPLFICLYWEQVFSIYFKVNIHSRHCTHIIGKHILGLLSSKTEARDWLCSHVSFLLNLGKVGSVVCNKEPWSLLL